MISKILTAISKDYETNEVVRKRIKIRVLIILGLLILIGLLLVGSWYWKNHRSLTKYSVKGNREVSESQIIALTQTKKGIRLNTVSSAKINKRLKKNPFIESAIVKAELPGTLVIEVKEREPVARLEGAVTGMIDGKGFGMPAKKLTVYDLPIISGIKKSDFDSSWGVIKNPVIKKVATELLKLKNKVPAAYHLISEIRQNDDQSVWIYTFDGAVPVLAKASNLAENTVVLKNFWNQVVKVTGKDRFTYIDVRQDGVIATKEHEGK
ncbi:MAG: FtsQ-type POTRA domain-containing protein [Bacteroidetes bacterium]|nr:FtsQ-type POTRA domain-containing protein [Bacteroidota bacterium]